MVWIITLIGIVMLFRAGRHPLNGWRGRNLVGSMLAGWGIFNFTEGLLNHQILGIHHVLPGHPLELLWDMLFLATGPLFVWLGWRLNAVEDPPDARVPPRG